MHVDLRAVGAVVVPVGLAFVVITIVVVVIAVMISLTTVTTWLPASGKSRVFRIHCEMQRILEIKRVSPTPKSLCQALFGIQKQGARVISFGHRLRAYTPVCGGPFAGISICWVCFYTHLSTGVCCSGVYQHTHRSIRQLGFGGLHTIRQSPLDAAELRDRHFWNRFPDRVVGIIRQLGVGSRLPME